MHFKAYTDTNSGCVKGENWLKCFSKNYWDRLEWEIRRQIKQHTKDNN